MKERIAFVIHRYGEGVDGGAAAHCRAVAEHLLSRYDVEVLTSVSKDYPYNRHFNTGVDELGGVTVRRFPIERLSDETQKAKYRKMMMQGDHEAEKKWMEENGPFCPQLIDYLTENCNRYRTVFFFGYNHYLTYAGITNIERSVLIPLAHDEGTVYTTAAETVFRSAGAFLFNSVEEKELVERLFGKISVPDRVVCYGIDPGEAGGELPTEYESLVPYIIYAGRVTQNKNFAELVRYFIEYKKRNDNNLKLVVLGKIGDGFSLTYHRDIIYPGYVSEDDKRSLMKNATLLVLPSKVESLSIVVLESFMQETPVLVNGHCPVLAGQCRRSNGGLYYTDYAEFETELNYMLDNPEISGIMGRNGHCYVTGNYSWEKVIGNFAGIIEETGNENDR